jgi:short-subunit dehydrogenase
MELARAFATEGNTLSVVARRKDALEKLAGELKVKCHVVAADLARPDANVDWLKDAEAALGAVDILINNAGMSYLEPIDGIDMDQARKLFQINLHTPVAAMHHVLPQMVARRSGVIINVASGAAFQPAPYLCHYNASKAALASFSESLRMEMKTVKKGVDVITVYPGPIKTPMGDRNWEQIQTNAATKLFLPEGDTGTLSKLVLAAVKRKKPRVIYPRWPHRVTFLFPGISRFIATHFSPPPTGRKTPELPGDQVR